MVSADANGAVLRVDGVERHYNLSREYSGAYAAPSKTQLSVASGYRRPLLDRRCDQWPADPVSRRHRRHLGGDQRAPSPPAGHRLPRQRSGDGGEHRQRHGQGLARALNSVKVGAIEVLGVEAVVVEGGSPTDALLGMSFLGRVSWREEQGVLVLESKTS